MTLKLTMGLTWAALTTAQSDQVMFAHRVTKRAFSALTRAMMASMMAYTWLILHQISVCLQNSAILETNQAVTAYAR